MNKRRIHQLKLLLCKNGKERAEYIKKNNLFYHMGEHCYWHPHTIPHEGYLMTIHNNVAIAANVCFITHDIMEHVFNGEEQTNEYHQFVGSIEIFDNSFIGANSIIMYNVRIGPNAIVAAGSVVTKDVPEGCIVGGNPARVIGSYYDLKEKRKHLEISKANNIEEMIRYFWN